MSLSIGVGCASLIWIGASLGLVPDPIVEQGESRIKATHTIALNVETFAENRRTVNLRKILERTLEMDDSLDSIGIKKQGYRSYLMALGKHKTKWDIDQRNDAGKQIGVDIFANKRPWGKLEIVFKPFETRSGLLGIGFPFGLVVFVFSSSSLFSWIILSKSLRYLNPSNVVPSRVRSALDTLAEGLVLLNEAGEIAHANEAFRSISAMESSELLGGKLDQFGWKKTNSDDVSSMPWNLCLETQQRVSKQIVNLELPDSSSRQFAINATPIFNGKNSVRGVLVSFDDVTALENKNVELAKIIGSLRNSRDEVARQNERLNFLASYDPLTKCMNRRSFFELFEKYWTDQNCPLLNLMMLDIDHFKGINDTYGHSVGDEVLILMGDLLRKSVGDRGVVCRYGGEEFIVLIPGITIDQFESFANDLRRLIEQAEANGVKFTASFGLSCKEFIPMDPQHLLDQADECLYIAKRAGRNQTVRFDQRTEYTDVIKELELSAEQKSNEIPYSAVTGLLSALSFRCPRTAEHSIRVADLCVVVAEKLMTRRELYQLEVAALLHDIGKIGVPDSVLLKPGPLTDDEWVLMRKHDDIGAEIVRNALSSDTVAHYIDCHHQRFSGGGNESAAEADQAVPLASSIISVCDAYDAMVNERVYRAAMPIDDALEELQRNAPSQFDPMVVEILCEHIRSGHHGPKTDLVRPVYSSKQATAIGKHIEELYEAIEDEDVNKLKSVVCQLRHEASNDANVTDVADRLDEAIGVATNDDLDEVLVLATEVMQICRESRTTFVDAAESIAAVD
jgi:diguanylate cyclase (GGDEF)-like protein/putative nucleotidyltransferase with HDIG domain/PAS domain S-box-containing protein